MSIEVEPGAAVADFATAVTGLLDQLDYHAVTLLTDRKQLDLVADLLTVQSRLSGVVHTVLGQVDRSEAAMTAHGVPTVSWLASELRYTRGQAAGMLHHANDLHRFSQIGDALRDGRANDRQVQAVTQVLKKLPTDLAGEAEAKAQATMVGFCEEFNSHELTGLARHLLEVVAPEVAEEPADVDPVEAMKAVLRRQAPVVPGAPGTEDESVTFGEYELSLATRELKKGDEVHMLTTGEFAVLKALVQHAREPLTRDKLMNLARGREWDALERSIDVQISRLRRLIEPDPSKPRYIQTVWGVGYVFVPDGSKS
mgnify:CR=1 FL=1